MSNTLTSTAEDTKSSPVELRIPTNRKRSEEQQVERQFDQLLNILAIDQACEAGFHSSTTVPARIDTARADVTRIDSPESSAHAAASSEEAATPIEVSIVISCRNNAGTIGNSVLKAIYALEKLGVQGEVIVADASSRDDSVEIAEALGARIVHATDTTCENALPEGIAAARGQYCLIADGDERYDFTTIHKFYDRLCEGADVVQGCRTARGGGRIMPGAMHAGEALLDTVQAEIARRMFRTPVHDIHCVMRAFRKDFYDRIQWQCNSSEFLHEMLIRSTECGARISEVPITYYKPEHQLYPEARSSISRALRTLRYFSTRKLRLTWLLPAFALLSASSIIAGLVFFGSSIGLQLGAGSLFIASVMCLAGVQMTGCAFTARVFAERSGLRGREANMARLGKFITYERCVLTAVTMITVGESIAAWRVMGWFAAGCPAIDLNAFLMQVIPAATGVLAGIQLLTTSFLIGLIRLPRPR
ncbi:MAG: glycosyltransferase family 2 protein [Pirellulales bacterium]